ncbi:MAG: chromosomal replication initiator protein DnaA [Trueperaceae bacterium]
MSGIDGGIWDDVISRVRDEIPEVEFRTWFSNVTLLGIEDGSFMIGVPTNFARDWIRSHYSAVIESSLQQLGVANPRLGFQLLPSKVPEQQDIFSAQPEPAADAAPARNSAPQLNPKYVFTNFIVGENNNFAHAAALAVAEAPGKAYNPLFLYGDAGLGKTHLMNAVGHAVAERYPSMSIEYVTTEAFTNDLITAIREDRMTHFRDRYRSIDVLLIDDIQFIAGKERTQEEFFHTFNALYESGKQLIMSSDRPPKDIPTLENRLRSRFEWGLITDIQAPELETRIAILAMNAEYRGVKVPPDVIDYIARHVTSNVRELEGALVRAIVYSSMSQQPLNRQTVAKALSDVFAPSDLQLTMNDIVHKTAEHFSVRPDDVKGKSRRQELVVPRQIAMFLIRELTPHSFPEIGSYFSGRDHSTVMYAVNKVQTQVDQGDAIAREVRTLKETLV